MAPFSVTAALLGHQVDDRVGRARVELRRVRAAQSGHVARELDHRHLHPQADAEERHALFARVADGVHLALDAAAAEAGRHQDAVHLRQQRGRAAPLDLLGVDVVQVDAAVVADAAVNQRLVEALVRFDQVDVLADQADLDLGLRALEPVHDALPAGQLGRARPDVEQLADLVVDAFGVEADRHLVDAVDVLGREHRVGARRW